VRDDLREYVVEHLGDERSGVHIADETGLLKKVASSLLVPSTLRHQGRCVAAS
jgi:hypothetical protein